jgi:hypothetical protein
MNARALRFVVVGIVAVLVIGGKVTASRGAKGGNGLQHELTPEVRAAGLTFRGVSAADQQWVLGAIAQARPEAQQLIGAIDGFVTITTADVPGVPWVGVAEQNSDNIVLNTAWLDGERKADRATAVLHELGHIIDFELIPDDQMNALAGAIPSEGGGCNAVPERFADTFAKWALRGAVSAGGAGYGIMSPASLETWGQPLGLLAAQQSLSG